MQEHEETKWKVVVIFRRYTCISSLLKGKLPAKLGIPYTACHVTPYTLSCFQISHPNLAIIRGRVPTIDKMNITYCVFYS